MKPENTDTADVVQENNLVLYGFPISMSANGVINLSSYQYGDKVDLSDITSTVDELDAATALQEQADAGTAICIHEFASFLNDLAFDFGITEFGLENYKEPDDIDAVKEADKEEAAVSEETAAESEAAAASEEAAAETEEAAASEEAVPLRLKKLPLKPKRPLRLRKLSLKPKKPQHPKKLPLKPKRPLRLKKLSLKPKRPLCLRKLSLKPKRPLRRKMPIRLHPVRNPPVQQKRLPKVPLLKQVPRSRNSPRQDLHPLQYHLLLIR